MRLLVVLTSFLLLTSGCSILEKNIKTPTADVVGVELRALDFNQATLVMLVDVKNPNAISIPLAGFDYSLALMNTPFISGKNNQQMDLKAGATARIEVPIAIEFIQMFNTVKATLNANEVPYGFEASLVVDIPVIGKKTLSVKHQDTLPIPRMPSIEVQSMSLKNISMTGVELDMSYKLVNPNVFDIKLEKLNYTLDVSGKQWAAGSQSQPVTAKAGESAVIAMPVKLSIKDIGGAFLRKMSDKNATFDYKVNGDSSIKAIHPKLGEVDVPLNLTGKMSVAK